MYFSTRCSFPLFPAAKSKSPHAAKTYGPSVSALQNYHVPGNPFLFLGHLITQTFQDQAVAFVAIIKGTLYPADGSSAGARFF